MAPQTSYLIGYARVSTADQTAALQHDALTQAGCQRIFTDEVSGATAERPQLAEALGHLRPGDSLVVWRLDRLAVPCATSSTPSRTSTPEASASAHCVNPSTPPPPADAWSSTSSELSPSSSET